MKISKNGMDLIKKFEGVRLRPYRCPAGLWTIGVGSVMYPEQLRMKMPERMKFCLKPEHFRDFTEEEVDELFRHDLARFERGVSRLINVELEQSKFDALVSFAFNVGLGNLQASTLRSKINRGDIDGAANEFPKWRRAGGKILKGLVRRRQAEQILFLA
jgi:lysozyme